MRIYYVAVRACPDAVRTLCAVRASGIPPTGAAALTSTYTVRAMKDDRQIEIIRYSLINNKLPLELNFHI